MEQFPKLNKKEKKKISKPAVALNAALVTGMASFASEDVRDVFTPTFENNQSDYSQSATEQDLSHTTLPENLVIEKQITGTRTVSEQNADSGFASNHNAEGVRPHIRPEEKTMLSHFEHPIELLDFALGKEAERLGVDSNVFKLKMYELFNMLADIESDWRPDAVNPKSSAASYYQYLTANNDPGEKNGSVHTSIKRIYAMLGRHGVYGAQPGHANMAWADDLYEHPEKIIKTGIDEQQIMVLADIVQKKGSDELLRNLTESDPALVREAALQIYYKMHHTDPDAATIRVAERDADKYFPKPDTELSSVEKDSTNSG